ncbi:hypothetical protein SLOPH_520, partial [Spraguea lophii 42_110]
MNILDHFIFFYTFYNLFTTIKFSRGIFIIINSILLHQTFKSLKITEIIIIGRLIESFYPKKIYNFISIIHFIYYDWFNIFYLLDIKIFYIFFIYFIENIILISKLTLKLIITSIMVLWLKQYSNIPNIRRKLIHFQLLFLLYNITNKEIVFYFII